MKINDILRLSLNSLTHRGLRSWLTILGIIIGVASVIAMISIGTGMSESVESQMSGLGADILTISPGYTQAQGSQSGFERMRPQMGGGMMGVTTSDNQDEPTLTNADIYSITEIEGVEAVGGTVSAGRSEIEYLSESVFLSIEGIDPNVWEKMTISELESGRWLTQADNNGIIVGNGVAYNIFDQDLTLNKQIKIEGKTFKIIGILDQSGTGMFGGDDRSVFMTNSAARNLVDDIDSNEYSAIEIKITDTEQMEQITENIENILYSSRMVTEETQDFTVTSPASMAETISSTMETLSFFFIGIATISLLVGAIGIANTMFMSVMERTRLIGILKSLGTKNSEIMKLFIAESAIIGFMGGLLGVFLGLILVGIMSSMGFGMTGMMPGRFSGAGSTITVTPELVVFALAFATIIGIISGLIPAKKASSLQIVEAMRSE